MAVDRVKFQDIVSSQVPQYVRDDFPLLVDFLEEYYVSQETQSGSYDLIQNLDQYVKVDELYDIKDATVLNGDIDSSDVTIETTFALNFTEGFPDRNGLIQIDNEIISYEYKTETGFENCKRGFSGITSYIGTNTPDQLVFESTEASGHTSGALIYNLNVRFLKEFFKKLKAQVLPGFSERQLTSKLNQKNLIFGADSFYKSKGTDRAFKILFKALYGKNVEVIKPSNFLFKPSDANWQVTQDFVVEKYVGDPLDLKNLTIFQKRTGARGTVTQVEKIAFDGGDYYQIAIDYGYQRDINVDGTIFGKFEPNPKTKLTENVSIGSTILNVESTASFDSKGSLSLYDVDNQEVILTYQDKNLTQFLGVTTTTSTFAKTDDVRINDYSYAYVGINTDNEIRVKITATLKDLKLYGTNYLYEKDDTINIKTLGYSASGPVFDKWLYNVKTKWDVKSISVVDATQKIYNVETYDETFLVDGYRLEFNSTTGIVRTGLVSKIKNTRSFTVVLNDNINPSDLGFKYTFENQILRGQSTKHSQINSINANVLSSYSNRKDQTLVASNSIANYFETETNTYDRKVTFSGSANGSVILLTPNGDHGFYTGDAVYYEPKVTVTQAFTPDGVVVESTSTSSFDNLKNIIYFVKRVDSRSIQIANSKADLYRNKFIEPVGVVTDSKFCYADFYKKDIEGQKLYRRFSSPSKSSGNFITSPGYSGMLVNGVEILNYKSPNSVFYGDIKQISATAGGQGYDVINPPDVHIDDVSGIGATCVANVSGSLKEIRIIEPGFDYVGTPTVKISGGQGEGAQAEVKLAFTDHSVAFNAQEGTKTGINLTKDVIGFTTFHQFRQNEKVVYVTKGLSAVSGIVTDSIYYANIVGPSSISLHITENDANLGINTVDITSYGKGTQEFKSFERKSYVSSIVVSNSGSNYRNNQKFIENSGISTALNQFTIKNHGFSDEDIVRYTPGTNSIGGLSSSTDYYVRKVNNDTFSLSLVGTGSTIKTYYYENGIEVDVTSVGDGSFNFLPITVEIEGNIGVNTLTNQDFRCKVQPIFRGSVTSTSMSNNGVGYGASTILNFDRQPNITFNSGKGAQLTPIVSNGRIVDVVVNEGGSGYNSPPDLKISGIGSYCSLTPILSNGSITAVKIVSQGIGYSNDTTLRVASAGIDAMGYADINQWTINIFERNFDNIQNDDGFVNTDLTGQSLEYSHVYAPRKLREELYGLNSDGTPNFGSPDLDREDSIEIDSNNHSPIIGWAYDGNPIYGPYGFKNDSGGPVTQMRTGYRIKSGIATNRPSETDFPNGIFCEDFEFINEGDLDEFNGRYCVTPDFPNGTYAYFATLNDIVDSTGPFENSKRPVYPYLIGNSYYSKPDDFNYSGESNHNDYDIQSNEWLRNTAPYHLNHEFSGYDYVFESNKFKKESIDVTSATTGGVQNVGIITGGGNYRVKDEVVFVNEGSGGRGAKARVKNVLGKSVKSVSIASTEVDNVQFLTSSGVNGFTGFTSVPHKLNDNDIVIISGLSEYFEGFDGSYEIGFRSDRFILNQDVANAATTGLVTYFPVNGPIQKPTLRPNDILTINNEKVKVLNSDILNQRIRVIRNQYSTVGGAHTGLSFLIADSSKFNIEVGAIKTTKNFQIDDELYFNPAESLGIGTENVIGSGNTITFSNPGAGLTQVFVPEQAIYILNHNLNLNDKVEYRTNSGESIIVRDSATGVTTSFLTDYDNLYAVPFTNRFVGLSTNKVGVSTVTGKYVGVNGTSGPLFFIEPGTNVYHSLRTRKTDVINGKVNKNVVTVSTASTHGLFVDDLVNFNLVPINQIDVVVKYDDYNRRIVFDPQNFASGDVDTSINTINIANNPFVDGDKVIHTSTSPSGGLVNEAMYYVNVYEKNRIRLVRNKSDLKLAIPPFVDITSASSGTLSKVNPSLNVSKSNTVRFDLSDPSLSFNSNSTLYSAFDMNLFSDSQYKTEFLKTSDSRSFEVTKSGRIGIDATANLTLVISKDIPSILWYQFKSINTTFAPTTKTEIVIDEEVNPFNRINVVPSKLDGLQRVAGVGATTFDYNIAEESAITSYTRTNAAPYYITDSGTAYGAINEISVINGGFGYKGLPGITTVTSGFGTGAILVAESEDIGNILNTRFTSNDIGFDYPTDYTLRPTANLPEIVELEPLSSFEQIGITSSGRNYLVAPDLIVIDAYTGDVIEDVELNYQLSDNKVNIVRNTNEIYNVKPTIQPINNSNGVGIASLSYDDSSKVVRLYLDTIFSDAEDFPYYINSKVMVENVSIGVGTTGKGYNSNQYDYALFNVVGVKTNLGGSGAYVEYDLSTFLADGDIPGNVVTTKGSRVISSDDFPIFNPVLKKNDFFKGERITNEKNTGTIESWNRNSGILKIDTNFDFNVGDTVRGETSNTKGVIEKVYTFEGEITTGSGATVYSGWQRDTGFFNDSLQRLPNNEYYQNFSYSLQSEIPFETWNDAVGALNHTAGFQKFSDLQIISKEEFTNLIVSTEDSEISTIVDIEGSANLNCFYDFDNVTEITENVNGKAISREIVFDNTILADYFQSIGNRVLSIDDFSGQFNSNERRSPFQNVSIFSTEYPYTKVFTYVRDRTFTDERQFAIVNVLQDNQLGFVNQYATIETYPYLGYFDYQPIGGGQWGLSFYPVKFQNNIYDVSTVAFNIVDGLYGEDSINLGDVVNVSSSHTFIPAGITTSVVSVATSYRALKIVSVVEDKNANDFYSSELNVVHDGTTAYLSEYGNLNESRELYIGIGSYHAKIDSGNLVVEFIPSVSTALSCTAGVVAISDNGTTVANNRLNVSNIESSFVSIPSSGSPSAVGVATYINPYNSAYYFLSIEDTTNSEYEIIEIGAINSTTNQEFVEFGNIYTGNAGLGTVGINSISSGLEIVYTPIANAAIEVRAYAMQLQIFDDNQRNSAIDLNSVIINANHGVYEGTKLDVRTNFELNHRGDPIFRRVFDGSSETVVNLTSNTITVPNHFFVTGENVTYSSPGAGNTAAISIASTSVPGVGTTDILPSSAYVIKVGDGQIKLAPTAGDALATPPNPFDLTSVGIGNSHVVTSTNPNAKALMSIDNIIQSPITPSDNTATLSENVEFDVSFEVSGITSFFSGDIIKIDNEYMKVLSTGVGGTTFINVTRARLGSSLESHTTGATVTKFNGNYNISESTVYFVDAPYGNNPIGSITNPPDERDWTGITTSSTFQGRTWMKRAGAATTFETYYSNYVFDDVSTQFTGLTSVFTLQSNSQNVTGVGTDLVVLINGIYQKPQGVQQSEPGDYEVLEGPGITSIRFTGNNSSPAGYDPNKGAFPIGGLPVSLGSSEGFGYQPLVAAGGTAIVSGLGTISSISIGNSGSGYRAGIQTVVNVGVQTYSGVIPNIEFIGTATVSNGNIVSVAITNPGSGYSASNPPIVVFDDPLSYKDIPLVYKGSGSGQGATVDIVVGRGSSVIDFKMRDQGFGYTPGDELFVEAGGTSGIPTAGISSHFTDFSLTIDRTFTDQFNAWSLGEFEVLDNIDSEFNGIRKSFRLQIEGNPISIQAKRGSNIELDKTLLIFINNILQEPGLSYKFNGGSIIEFTEAPAGPVNDVPNTGDSSKILFYKGAGEVDVVFTDVLETVKTGDTLEINHDVSKGQTPILDQNARVVTGINTVDTVETNPYASPGVTTNQSIVRPVDWCLQTVDKIIDGSPVTKDRVKYEPEIYPAAYLIQPVSVSTSFVHVDTVRPLFESTNEAANRVFQREISMMSQDNRVGASATALVSIGGTIESLILNNGGEGYPAISNAPIFISAPIGFGATFAATATAEVNDGSVTKLNIVNAGSGYTYTNPPSVFIEPPSVVKEDVGVTSYFGDYGVIVGFGNTTFTAGLGTQTQIIFDFYIPTDSYMRDGTYVGAGITVSGISTGDFLTVYNSNVSIGGSAGDQVISLYNDNTTTLAITTSFCDSIYQVADYEQLNVNVLGVGMTAVTRVFVNVGSISTISFGSTVISFDSTAYTYDSQDFIVYQGGISSSFNFGSYSWGKIGLSTDRLNPAGYPYYGENGYAGISTGALITRTNSLKFKNYTS